MHLNHVTIYLLELRFVSHNFIPITVTCTGKQGKNTFFYCIIILMFHNVKFEEIFLALKCHVLIYACAHPTVMAHVEVI